MGKTISQEKICTLLLKNKVVLILAFIHVFVLTALKKAVHFNFPALCLDDYAQHQEIDDCMSAIDCDGDGIIDLNDFILFAIRLRHLHSIQHSNLTTVKI